MMLFALSFLVLLPELTHEFVRYPPVYSSRKAGRFGTNHYDDFDYVIGDQEGSAPPDRLQELVRQVKQEDVRKDAQLAKNWKMGNWKVRGFSLDKYDASQGFLSEDTTGRTRRLVEGADAAEKQDMPQEPPATVHVSKVHNSFTPNQVVVGRTDGSVCFVTLGSQYLTQFIHKLTAKEADNDVIAVQSELVRSDDMALSESDDETPFKVDRQFVAHDTSIVTMATAENLVHDQNLLFTASEGSGEIRAWGLPDAADAKVIPLYSLTDAHEDTVAALMTLSLTPDDEEHMLLFSASKDGSMALWEMQTGDLVFKCQMMEDGEPCSILCADVDSSRSIVYLGMASGHLVCYFIKDLVEGAGDGGTCPVPSGRFLAHEGIVTAVSCAGEGTLARSSPGASSSILLTGGSDGVVKQWEIMSRNTEPTSPFEPSLKIEQWPRLANQRMQRRAHLFKGHDEMSIAALASVDASKFLSAGADGTVRAWNPSTGEELFRMDGFSDELSSLCLQDDLYLITDGMENLVCVHDFDVGTNEVEDGYELEW